MFDYDKILEIKKVNLEYLDKDTLIDWSIVELGKDEDGLENWIEIEVWLDEDNKVKILESNEYDTIELTNILTDDQKNHIYNLIQKDMKELVLQ